VADEREGIGSSSRTNLCREWSSCSRDGRRGRIHGGSWPGRPAGSSSWPGTTSTDPHQLSLGWPDVCPHASNHFLVIVVTQGAVGLEKSKAAVRRMRVLWICLARNRIWTAHVTVFNETYWRALDGSLQQLEFHGHYSKYMWEILSSPRTVRLLMLTSGPVSWAMMVSEPGSPLLGVGSAVIFFYIGCWRWRVALSQFFEWNLLPWFIRAYKTTPKKS
jgi:hypothetical protein